MKLKGFLSQKVLNSLFAFLLLFTTFSPVIALGAEPEKSELPENVQEALAEELVSEDENSVAEKSEENVDVEVKEDVAVENPTDVGTTEVGEDAVTEEPVAEEPVAEKEGDIMSTSVEANKVTYGNVQVDTSYVYPNNEVVSLKFLSLPEGEYYLSIEEVVTEYGTGYEFTSDLKNGTFIYNLHLPNTLDSEEVEVKYSEDGMEYSRVDNVQTIDTSEVVLYSLNHFTIFIITDDDATYTDPGNWVDYPTQGYGDTGVHFPDPVVAAGETATWLFDSIIAGDYRVYISWSTHPNRTTAAPYTLNYNGGSYPFTINQELLADQVTTGGSGEFSGWYSVGEYTLDTTSNLVLEALTNAGTEYVIADEVMLIPADLPTVTPLITADTTPELTGTLPLDDDANPTAITVTVDGTDYLVNSDGAGNWTLADDTISPALADGTYDVTLSYVDYSGATITDATVDELIVDTVAPVVEITAPADGATVSGTIDVYGSVTDLNPDHYYYAVLGTSVSQTVTEYSSFTDQLLFSWDTTTVPNGSYTIRLAARDAAGNRDDSAGSIDEITVIVNNVGSVQGRKYEDVDMDGFHDDNVTEPRLDGWTINLYDDSWVPLDSMVTGTGGYGIGQYGFADLEFGTYYVCEEMQTGWVQTGPIVGANPVNFSNVAQNDAVAVANGSGSATEGGVCWEFTIDSPDEFYGWVKFGNYFDDEPPIVSGEYGASTSYDGELIIDVDVEDELHNVVNATYEILDGTDSVVLSGNIDDGNTTPWTCSEYGASAGDYGLSSCVTPNEAVDVSALATGYYDVRVCGEDEVGNVGTGDNSSLPTGDPAYCYRYTVLVDNTSPEVDTLEPQTFYEGDSFPSIELTATDDTALDVLMIGVTTPGGSFYFDSVDLSGASDTVDLGVILANALGYDVFDTSLIDEGDYLVEYFVIDAAGNLSDLYDVTYTLVNVPPVLTLLADGATEITINEGDTVDFLGTFTDPSLVDAGDDYFDDEPWWWVIDFGDGNYANISDVTITPDTITPSLVAQVFDFETSHTYGSVGADTSYTATFIMCEDSEVFSAEPNPLSEGECSAVTVTINVNNVLPTVNISANPGTSTTEQAIIMTANYAGADSPVTVTGWSCNFTVSGTPDSVTTPATPGTYTCTVTVVDADGDTATATQTVTVNAAPAPTPTPTPRPTTTSTGGNVLGVGDNVTPDEEEQTDEDVVEEDEGEVLGEMTCDETSMASGYVYYDENGDGEKDEEEEGLADIVVEIYAEIDGERTLIVSVKTDENGYWEADVCPGNYEVEVDKDSFPDDVELSDKDEDIQGISITDEDGVTSVNFEVEEKGGGLFSYWWILLLCLVAALFLGGAMFWASRRSENQS